MGIIIIGNKANAFLGVRAKANQSALLSRFPSKNYINNLAKFPATLCINEHISEGFFVDKNTSKSISSYLSNHTWSFIVSGFRVFDSIICVYIVIFLLVLMLNQQNGFCRTPNFPLTFSH